MDQDTIVAEYERRLAAGELLDSNGCCIHAARSAQLWFLKTTNQNSATLSGLLISKEKLLMRGDSNSTPDIRPLFCSKRCALRKGCCWELVEELPEPVELHGGYHEITPVPGTPLLIDWGLRQFKNLPEDLMLYLR